MNDTHQTVPDSAVVPSSSPAGNEPPVEPQGSFVIADLPVLNQSSESNPSALDQGQTVSSFPRMAVETIPEEPQPPEPPAVQQPFTETSSVDVPQPTQEPLSVPQQNQPVEPLPSVNQSVPNEQTFMPMIPAQESMTEPAVLQPQETVVIPTASVEQNFIPQGLEQPVQNQSQTPMPVSPGKSSRGIFRYLIIVLVVLLLGGLILLGGSYLRNMMTANQEVTLVYWGLWEDSQVIQPVIAKFEQENPTINIEYKKQNIKPYREVLEAAINREEGPDIFRFHTTWIPMLRNQIEPVPESVMSVNQFKNNFYPVMVNDLVAGTTIWGLPTMFDGLGLYVNKALFAAAGVAVPKTYEELLGVVPRLTVRNGNDIVTSAIALGSAKNIEHVSDILSLMILQNGGSLVNPVTLEVEEALVFFRKFSNPNDALYTWNEYQDNSIAAFASGRVAMIFAPSWRAHEIKTLNPTLNFEIEPVPQLPGNTTTWASYWAEGVSSKSKHKQQAFKFLQYLASQEAVSLLNAEAGKQRLFGAPPALKSLGVALQNDPFVGAYIKQAPTAQSFPLASNTYDNGLNDQMVSYMNNAINGYIDGSSPAQMLESMNKGFKQIFARYGLESSR